MRFLPPIFLVVAAIGAWLWRSPPQAVLPSASVVGVADCRVVDGDTLRCGEERIRLLGIDAPELPGHCRKGRHCAPGDPWRSTDTLRTALSQGPVQLDRVGIDRYGRTLATVRAGSQDLSCWQLRQGSAIYRGDWDDGGRVAAICPSLAR